MHENNYGIYQHNSLLYSHSQSRHGLETRRTSKNLQWTAILCWAGFTVDKLFEILLLIILANAIEWLFIIPKIHCLRRAQICINTNKEIKQSRWPSLQTISRLALIKYKRTILTKINFVIESLESKQTRGGHQKMYWHAIFLTLILFTVVYAVSKYVIYQLLIDQFNFKCTSLP